MRALFALVSVGLLACSPVEKSVDGSNAGTTVAKDVGASALVDSNATIKSIAYDAASHSINFKLEYGGCKATKHVLVLSDVCAESYPQQCSGVLKVPKDFDGSCKMFIQEDLSAPLDPAFDAAYVTVKTSLLVPFQVLVDKTGKVAEQTTPPSP